MSSRSVPFHYTPAPVAVTDPMAFSPSAVAAATSVAPVVTTSSTIIAPNGVPTRARNRTGDRLSRSRPACRERHNGRARTCRTGKPAIRPTSRANSNPGSIPIWRRRAAERGTGTSAPAPGGRLAAMAGASTAARPAIPRYLRSCTRALANPSCWYAAHTVRPVPTSLGAAGKSNRAQASHKPR